MGRLKWFLFLSITKTGMCTWCIILRFCPHSGARRGSVSRTWAPSQWLLPLPRVPVRAVSYFIYIYFFLLFIYYWWSERMTFNLTISIILHQFSNLHNFKSLNICSFFFFFKASRHGLIFRFKINNWKKCAHCLLNFLKRKFTWNSNLSFFYQGGAKKVMF